MASIARRVASLEKRLQATESIHRNRVAVASCDFEGQLVELRDGGNQIPLEDTGQFVRVAVFPMQVSSDEFEQRYSCFGLADFEERWNPRLLGNESGTPPGDGDG